MAKRYPLVICYIAIEHTPYIEIVDYLFKMVIFYSKMLVYQRVSKKMVTITHIPKYSRMVTLGFDTSTVRIPISCPRERKPLKFLGLEFRENHGKPMKTHTGESL